MLLLLLLLIVTLLVILIATNRTVQRGQIAVNELSAKQESARDRAVRTTMLALNKKNPFF